MINNNYTKPLVVEEVAALYGCSVRTIHERTRLAEIPHFKHPGRRRCYFPQAWLEAHDGGAELESIDLTDGGRIVRPKQAPVGRGRKAA